MRGESHSRILMDRTSAVFFLSAFLSLDERGNEKLYGTSSVSVYLIPQMCMLQPNELFSPALPPPGNENK